MHSIFSRIFSFRFFANNYSKDIGALKDTYEMQFSIEHNGLYVYVCKCILIAAELFFYVALIESMFIDELVTDNDN